MTESGGNRNAVDPPKEPTNRPQLRKVSWKQTWLPGVEVQEPNLPVLGRKSVGDLGYSANAIRATCSKGEISNEASAELPRCKSRDLGAKR